MNSFGGPVPEEVFSSAKQFGLMVTDKKLNGLQEVCDLKITAGVDANKSWVVKERFKPVKNNTKAPHRAGLLSEFLRASALLRERAEKL